MRIGCLEGKKTFCYRERMREMKFDFALKVFRQKASRWIEDLSSTKSRQI